MNLVPCYITNSRCSKRSNLKRRSVLNLNWQHNISCLLLTSCSRIISNGTADFELLLVADHARVHSDNHLLLYTRRTHGLFFQTFKGRVQIIKYNFKGVVASSDVLYTQCIIIVYSAKRCLFIHNSVADGGVDCWSFDS